MDNNPYNEQLSWFPASEQHSYDPTSLLNSIRTILLRARCITTIPLIHNKAKSVLR